MSAPFSQNSRNPANDASLAGAFSEILGKFLQGVDDMLPAVVIAYDRASNRAIVRPLITMLTTDGAAPPRAEVASVPVFNIGAGNAVLSFNIKPGDLGWIKANDRDISLFLQSEVEASPNTVRKHDFGDSVFFPDSFRSRWTLDAGDEDSTVLQTIDGTQRVILHDDHLQLHSADRVLIDAPVIDILGTDITLVASATLRLEGDVISMLAVDSYTLTGSEGSVFFTSFLDMVAGARITVESLQAAVGGTLIKAHASIGTVDMTGFSLRALSGMAANINGSLFVQLAISSFSNITALGSLGATLGVMKAKGLVTGSDFHSDVLNVNFNAHVHGGVTVGGGTTAIPQ